MTIKNTTHIYKAMLSRSERLAEWASDKVGTTGRYHNIFLCLCTANADPVSALNAGKNFLPAHGHSIENE